MPNQLRPAHKPLVPTAEAGAPASTYDRGEGAPTGATRGQAATPTGNRYWDIYAAGADAREKFVEGLPADRRPIETIRGTERTYWSPRTKQGKYGTALEAAFGVRHKQEAATAAANAKQRTELLKERIKARKPFEVHRVIDPDTGKETLRVFDQNTGKFIDTQAHEDWAIVDSLRAAEISEEEFVEHYKSADPERKKRLLKLYKESQKKEKKL
jgi:hypothetical protein